MILLLVLVYGSMAGCGTSPDLLPDEKDGTRSPWETFADFQLAFDQVVPKQTSVDDLNALGFDPYRNPNVAVVPYTEVRKAFQPTGGFMLVKPPTPIQRCFQARERCVGWLVTPQDCELPSPSNRFPREPPP